MHWVSDCPKAPICSNCNRRGHHQSKCRLPSSSFKSNSHHNHATMSIFNIGDDISDWIMIDCQLNGSKASLMADSGSRLAVIQQALWEQLGSPKLKKGISKAKSYSGHFFEISGSFICSVTYQGVTLQLECHVAPKGAMNLFGLPWIKAFEAALQRPIATTLSNFSHPSNNTKNSNDNMPKQFNRQNEVRRRTFAVGDNVLVLNYRYNKSMWLQGKVVEGAGVVWKVHVPILNAVVRRHINQMRYFFPIPQQSQGSHHQQQHQIVHQEPETEPNTPQRRVRFADKQPEEQPVPNVQDEHNQNEVRRSNRNRRPPKLLDMDTSKTRYGYKN
ncbi:hypothetical protein niasHT_014158 [Heterodera trifolii]|uniref:CCHC-type domain-containing protein n=1 Tax=Heterodera trifolii TaxID=157864 RepID=A0ABD2KX69_9BILA